MDRNEARSLEHFVLNVTIPILIETENSAALHATGTLFEIENRPLIVTAQHIFDHLPDLTKLAFPHKPNAGDLSTLGTIEVLKPTASHVDVAVIELKSPETIQILKAGWKFLSLENIAYPSKSVSDESFFVSGYLEELTKQKEGRITSNFFTAYTQLIPITPDEAEPPVVEGLDLFFDYATKATLITGSSAKTPKLQGLSGASVWELGSVSGIWAPERAARVVGVQSSCFHSKYIRAKSWLAVAKVLEQADEHLAEAIRAKMIRNISNQ